MRQKTLQPGITVVLAGARNAEQATANAGAMNIRLNNDEQNFISEQLKKIQ